MKHKNTTVDQEIPGFQGQRPDHISAARYDSGEVVAIVMRGAGGCGEAAAEECLRSTLTSNADGAVWSAP